MIAIINRGHIKDDLYNYEVKLSQETITTFSHRQGGGLAECLRAAADAVDNDTRKRLYIKCGMVLEADNGI